MSSRSEQPGHRQSLTRERARLRNLHNKRSWNRPNRLTYRGHQLKAEDPDARHQHAYELTAQSGETLGSIELDHFQHPDDIVRFIDLAIQHDYQTARDWASQQFNWGFQQ